MSYVDNVIEQVKEKNAERAGVHPDRRRGPHIPGARHRVQPRLREGRPARAHRRAGAHDHVPRALGGRRGQGARQPRLPRAVQLRHRPLQGRPAPAPVREPRHHQVPGLRADLQEQPDQPAHGRRQGRLRLRPQGQVRRRDHALLPELHDRAVPPHRRRHRRARRRHRRGRARDRLHVRPVQAPHATSATRRADRQGPVLRRLAGPYRGHRLRPRLLRCRRCLNCKDDSFEGKTVAVSGSGNVAIYATREGPAAGREGRHHVRFHRLRSTIRTASTSTLREADQGSASAAASTSTPRASAGVEYHEGCAASGASRATSRCPAPRRTSCFWRTPSSSWPTAARSWPRARTCPPRSRRPSTCRKTAWCSAPARPPTRAAWPPAAWR